MKQEKKNTKQTWNQVVKKVFLKRKKYMVTYPSVNGRWKDILTRKENITEKNLFYLYGFSGEKKKQAGLDIRD